MFYAAIFFVVIILLLLFIDTWKPRNFPIGPMWLPIIGCTVAVERERRRTGMLCKAVDCMIRQYKDRRFLGIKVGRDKIVMVSGVGAIREMLHNEDLDGRPDGVFFRTRTFGMRLGIMFADDEFWKEQRRFVTKHLKNFGFARKGMIQQSENEAEHMVKDIRKIINDQGGYQAIVPMRNMCATYVLNTLWMMMAGVRFNKDNKDLIMLQDLLHNLLKSVDMMGALFSHFPFLRYVAPEYSGYKQFVGLHTALYEFMMKEVNLHKKTFNIDSEPRDLIDVYLKEIQLRNNNNNNNNESTGGSSEMIEEGFSEKQLLAMCLDLFLAGTETTNKTVNFAMLYLVRNPNVQAKAQKEIDSVVGRNRLPSIDDRPNLPYCDAVGLEALRFFMGYTFGLVHRASKDTKLCGKTIPKDTMLIVTHFDMSFSEDYWEKPFTFNPERFLVNDKLVVPDYYKPFGAGKRRCLGEILAKTNIFVLVTTFMQNFTLLVPEGHPVPTDVPIDGVTASTREYTAIIKVR